VLRRAPGRAPKFLHTGARGRPRKLFRSEALRVEQGRWGKPDKGRWRKNSWLTWCLRRCVTEVSVHKGLESKDCEEWKRAENEIMSLLKNDTWDIIKRSEGQNVIGCRFVLTNKYSSDDRIERHKARLPRDTINVSELIIVKYSPLLLGWR